MSTKSGSIVVALAVTSVFCATTATIGQTYVNFESPQTNALDLSPDGLTLAAVNTPDNRVEIFDVSPAGLTHTASIFTGIDPVSVRFLDNSTAWVVNHISDSISIVDLTTMRVVDTINTDDEPHDVIFAGAPTRAFVSVSQRNRVDVYDPSSPSAAPAQLTIQGEDPRALATDGTNVYAAIFESGNNTTILHETVVSSIVNPYATNPPPNDGLSFNPPQNGANPAPPAVGLIVQKQPDATWLDDNIGDWSAAVTWDLHDNDVAIINANTLTISYANNLMNAIMGLAVKPDGNITALGTDATNHIRYEPILNGIFLRVLGANLDPSSPSTSTTIHDLNPHLTYAAPSVSPAEHAQSIGDPRDAEWRSDGSKLYVTSLGTDEIAVFDNAMARTNQIAVGEGPTSIVLDESNDRAYVLNRFEGAISIVDLTSESETARIPLHDPTPSDVKLGRPFLYNTRLTSGTGMVSCASCHIDGRMDQLSWDLGAPDADVKPFDQVCNFGVGGCEDWHPMKGPMATQTLVGILETGPLHWRADRANFSQFNPAFQSLLGRASELTFAEMVAFETYVGSLAFPPNPFRNIDNALTSSVPEVSGNPMNGEILYMTAQLDGVDCVTCHTLPTGTNGQLTSAPLLQETQSIKIPQLRNMYEKTGFDDTSISNNRGFGYIKDGSIDDLFTFLQFPGFGFSAGATGDQERRDVQAFLFSFDTGTHAGVGQQSTLVDFATASASQMALLDQYVALAQSGDVGLVVTGTLAGTQRSGAYIPASSHFQMDIAGESHTDAALRALAAPGSEITYTLVPAGSETRIGLDRDEDSFFNRDELDACADPADPTSTPLNSVPADLNADGTVDGADLGLFLATWGSSDPTTDLNGDGTVDGSDLGLLLSTWGPCAV
ncbi:MAG: GC-type dockerin domain-anchored protein [Planctomycetota bacterium]